MSEPIRRFIVEIHDGIPLDHAFRYCEWVSLMGEISGTTKRRQHCYHTEFTDGASVSCIRRGKSERFIVSKPKAEEIAKTKGAKP